jgi:hypothetical protein
VKGRPEVAPPVGAGGERGPLNVLEEGQWETRLLKAGYRLREAVKIIADEQARRKEASHG